MPRRRENQTSRPGVPAPGNSPQSGTAPKERETAGSKLVWWLLGGALSAAAGAAGLWVGTQLVEEVTDTQLERVLAKPENVERIVKAATEPVAANLVASDQHRSAVLDAMARDSAGRFKGPTGASGAPGLPVGAVIAWPTDQQFPDGQWNKCDGSEVSIQGANDPLAKALGTTYGVATNPRTHVKLPDLRGYFLRGADSRGAESEDRVDLESPRSAGSIQQASQGGGVVQGVGKASGGQNAVAELTETHEVRPKNIAVHWLIRTQ